MDQDKIKATDYLLESIKLIVTLATIFFGGLLTYATTTTPQSYGWAFYAAQSFFTLSAILGVISINSIINKIFRSEEQAIQTTEVKLLSLTSLVSLGIGIALGATVLLMQTPTTAKPQTPEKHSSNYDSEVIVIGEIKSNIEIQKNDTGKITLVRISPMHTSAVGHTHVAVRRKCESQSHNEAH